METLSGKVESKSKKGNSIKVDGEWYSTFSSDDLDHVEWKDDVVFNWELAKGKYRNIKGKVRVSGSGAGTASPAASKGGWSNTGVELGHAANLAMRMMEQGTPPTVGTPEYYKQFLKYTEDMYKLMKGVRAKVDAGEAVTGGDTTPEATQVEEDETELF